MNVLSKSINVSEAALPDLLLLTPTQYNDARGMFMETYNERVMAELGLPTHWCQDNVSLSKRDVVRGLHYQIIHPQGKLVHVFSGAVLDITVDLRRSSRTFGQHAAIELSAGDGKMLWIPAGFAHGFVALTEEAGFAYKVTDYYFAPGERTILWNDPALGIRWPIAQDEAIVAAKDRAGVLFARAEVFE